MRRKMIWRDPRHPYRHRQATAATSPVETVKMEPSSSGNSPAQAASLTSPARGQMNDVRQISPAAEEPQQHYCLRWNNYQSNMTTVFHQLLQNEAFVDVTLACNDLSLKAHKVVLSACSAYFQKLLLENPCRHPTIIMPSDVCFSDLQFIIEFVYRGEIDVSQDELQSLLKTADQLKIKGLCEVSSESGASSNNHYHNQSQVTPRRPFSKLHHPSSRGSNHSQNNSSSWQQLSTPSPCKRLRRTRNNQEAATTPLSSAAAEEQRIDEDIVEEEDIDIEEDKSSLAHLVRKHQAHGKDGAAVTTRAGGATGSTNTTPRSGAVLTAGEGGKPSAGSREDMSLVMLETRRPTAGHEHSDSIATAMMSGQSFFHNSGLCDEYAPEPPAPTATPVTEPNTMLDHRRDICDGEQVKVKLETLRAVEQSAVDQQTSSDQYQNRVSSECDMDMSQHSMHSMHSDHSMDHQIQEGDHYDPVDHLSVSHSMLVTPELLGLLPNGGHSDLLYSDMMSDGSSEDAQKCNGGQHPGYHHGGAGDLTPEHHGGHRMSSGPKTWSQDDMELALDALRNHNMSLTKASATYGIPSTTLWQRAHRLGIDTPKKEGATKSWSEDSLNNALDALRTGTISANKASKAYGIPSSTLYKIARREGIRLAAPFNAAPTTWSPEDLERALEAIRTGQTSVQRASTEYGIPTGTLYGRCKREGIELSRSNPTPWSEDAMGEALEAVRVGQMSINQAAIHYNLPYSSLYGRFKRGKYDVEPGSGLIGGNLADGESPEGIGGNYHMQQQNQHDSPSQSYHNHSS